MTGIIDHGAGNIRSVRNALDALGAASIVSCDIAELERADRLILPGVGAAPPAIDAMRSAGLDRWLCEVRLPVLGICLGMQLLFERSDEGDTECLGILPGRVREFDRDVVKVPHVGWNRVSSIAGDPLFDGIGDREHFYFVHSFHAPVDSATIAVTDYGGSFASAVAIGRYRGVQFHPEKSGAAGLALLGNFIRRFGRDEST